MSSKVRFRTSKLLRTTTLFVLLTAIAGCGSGAPDLDDVKQNMSSEQKELGDPIVNSIGMVLVPIPSGEFQMGTQVNDEPAEKRYERYLQDPNVKKKLENGDVTKEDLKKRAKRSADRDKQQKNGPETPQHLVKITKPYYFGVCEITQKQYEAVMDAKPWAGQPVVEEGPVYAATYVTWENAVEFCRKLSEKESVKYRLPTEAEWEYACRAGSTTAYSFGNDPKKLAEYAWYDANAYKSDEQYPHLVGQKFANAWALYDMHGNAWEWCSDWYARYNAKQKEFIDPTGPKKGQFRVWRGGSFAEAPDNMKSASRVSYGRANYHPVYLAGFRVVRAFAAAQGSEE